MNYRKEIIINKDIATVFEKLTNPDFMVEWQESLDSYKKNEEGNWVYSDSHSGRVMDITEKILEKSAPDKFKVEYTTKGIFNIMDNKLEAIDENTTKWISDSEFQFTTLMMKVVGFFFGKSFQKQTEKDMKAFKKAVESL